MKIQFDMGEVLSLLLEYILIVDNERFRKFLRLKLKENEYPETAALILAAVEAAEYRDKGLSG